MWRMSEGPGSDSSLQSEKKRKHAQRAFTLRFYLSPVTIATFKCLVSVPLCSLMS